MNQKKGYLELPDMFLDGNPGRSIFSKDRYYLGFVFDDKSLGIKCHDGTIISHDKIHVGKDPAEYLAENIEPIREKKYHIESCLSIK